MATMIRTRKKELLRRLYETEKVVVNGDTVVAVFETTEEGGGDFIDLYRGLRGFRWSYFEIMKKITEFCREHPEKLAENGFSTFFLLFEEKPIVVRARTATTCLGNSFERYPLNYPYVWRAAGNRFVVVLPQHTKI
jgi:hypothetical protein